MPNVYDQDLFEESSKLDFRDPLGACTVPVHVRWKPTLNRPKFDLVSRQGRKTRYEISSGRITHQKYGCGSFLVPLNLKSDKRGIYGITFLQGFFLGFDFGSDGN